MKDLSEIVEEKTGEKYRTPIDIARFALKDAREKEGVLRQMQLMCVAAYIKAGVGYDDIRATTEERNVIEEIIKRQS